MPDGRFFYRMVGNGLRISLTTFLKSRTLNPNTISPDYSLVIPIDQENGDDESQVRCCRCWFSAVAVVGLSAEFHFRFSPGHERRCYARRDCRGLESGADREVTDGHYR